MTTNTATNKAKATSTNGELTSDALLKQFLGERESAWISVKQTNWLVSVIKRERKEYVQHRRYFIGSYEMTVAPNGAGCVKPCGGAKSGAEFDAESLANHQKRIQQQELARRMSAVTELIDAGKFDEARELGRKIREEFFNEVDGKQE